MKRKSKRKSKRKWVKYSTKLDKFLDISPNVRNCYNCIHCRSRVPIVNNKLQYNKMKIYCELGEWTLAVLDRNFVYTNIYSTNFKRFSKAKNCEFFETDSYL